MTSMIICVASIFGCVYLGKILDVHRNYKRMQIYLALGISITISATFLSLKNDAPDWISILITIMGGAPLNSVSVVSYQFQAEVIYPVSEVQGVSLMNVVNKLLTFGHALLVESITDDTPESVNF